MRIPAFKPRSFFSRRALKLAPAAFLVMSLLGCELGGKDASEPRLLRLKNAYPDLESGRFVALADFENADQARMFRTEPLDASGAESEAADVEQPSPSILRSRDETGAAGLKAPLHSANDLLTLEARDDAEPTLLRDWREYTVLLMSVYGPPEGLDLSFSILAGQDSPARWQRTMRVNPGWNLLRIDLAEAGEQIDLGDVRALTWRVPTLAAPVDLYLDDLILADNTRYRLGADAAEGQLYVLQRGRRIYVGSRGRFELAFSDGVIVRWTGEADENLTVASGMGPWPVALPADWAARREDPPVYDDPAMWASWGSAAVASQALIEATPFRCVIEGRWNLLNGAGDATATQPAAAPGHIWRYTIYPSGKLYVALESDSRGRGWPAPLAGYALALDGRRGFRRAALPPQRPDQTPATFALLARQPQPPSEADESDLLWMTEDAGLAARQRLLVSADERRLAVLLGDRPGADVVASAHHIRVWPRDINAAPEAESIAADYQNPAKVYVETGRLVSDHLGDLDADGFNESEGCYELAAEGDVLRFRFEPGGRLRYAPIFRVAGAAGRRAWVYANGRIIESQGRDAGGELLFSLDETVMRPVSVEVNLRGAF